MTPDDGPAPDQPAPDEASGRADVLTLAGPRDLLAALPYRLGFHPRRSLVLLELAPADPSRPGRHRLGVCVRGDLPATAEAVEAVAAAVAAPWERGTAGGPVVLVAYDDAEPDDPEPDDPEPDDPGPVDAAERPGPGPVLAPLVGALVARVEDRLRLAGSVVHDVVAVGPRRWRSLRCADPACCPPGGGAVAELATGAVAAEAVLRGLSAAPSREELAAAAAPPAPERSRRARRALLQASAAPWSPGRRRASLLLWAATRERYEGEHRGTRAGTLPAPESCGRLLAALADPAVRDAVLLDAVPGAAAGAAAAALLAGAGASPHLARALATAPDPRRAEAGARLALDLARHGDGEAAAGALAVAAWTWWSVGDGVRAAACAARALEGDGRQGLALLVTRALQQGLPPAWLQAGAGRPPVRGPRADEEGSRV